MEGYFPINQYCELTGLKKDTAYHRGIRGTIPAFKDAEGRWFFYFCNDEPNAPEGFCTLAEYAKDHNLAPHKVYYAIKCGRITESDVVAKVIHPKTAKGGRSKFTFIRKDAVILPKKERDHGYGIITQLCPEGYIPVNAWIKRENVKKCNAYNWMRCNYISHVQIKKHRYIPSEITVDDVYDNMGKARTERMKIRKQLKAALRSERVG